MKKRKDGCLNDNTTLWDGEERMFKGVNVTPTDV